MSDNTHPFEVAGLGKGPFRYVGHEKKLYVVPGCPPRAGSSCDYCGTAIADCFWIRSADGKKFKIGCDCIYKLDGDRSLIDAVKTAEAKVRTAARHEREAAKVAEGKALIADNIPVLAKLPHPNKHMASQGLTFVDYVDWMFKNAGTKGRLEVIATAHRLLP